MTRFDSVLLDTGGSLKKKYTLLLSNMGKAVALITLAVCALITFTDVGFGSAGSESFTSNLLLMLIASYVIYFSLESSGERLGEESEEYISALTKYRALCERVGGDLFPELRAFVENYLKEELEYRRKMRLYSIGSSEEELSRYLGGEEVPKRRARQLRRIAAMRAARLNPSSLLSTSQKDSRNELSSPEGRKLIRLIASLIPSSVCMCVTVSVVLSTKSGLDAAAVISGIMKLCSLVIIGARGYSTGYFHVKESVTAWTLAKARLLDAFLKEREKSKNEKG